MLKLFYFVNICFSIALLLSYLSPWVNPETFEHISLFGLLFPIWAIVNFLFVLFWLIKKPKYVWLSLITLLIGWNSLGRMFQWSSDESNDSNLHVMSYNIRDLQLSPHDKETKKVMGDFFDNRKEVDVFCIQEKRTGKKSILNQILSDIETVDSDHGMAIFSKIPIVDHGFIKVGGNTQEAIWADLKTDKDTIRIYSYHLSSNLISKETNALIEEGELSEKTWNGVKRILGSYTSHAVMRKKQLDVLMSHVRKSPYRVIMAGDMNDVPQSYVYRLITKKLKDSFLQKGKGIGVTFGETYPFLRIDYIFTDHTMEANSHQIDKVKFSDHYPLTVGIKL